jgi:hypothetical protein
MKYCSECGSENLIQAKFCKNCGAKLKETETEEMSKPEDINEVRQDPLDFKDEEDKKADSTVIVNNNKDSIISKLLYKTDNLTGEFRLSKTKVISIGMFLFMFLFGMYSGTTNESFFVVFIAAILFGLFFAIPTFIIGYVIGLILEKINS